MVAVVVAGPRNLTRVTSIRPLRDETLDSFAKAVARKEPGVRTRRGLVDGDGGVKAAKLTAATITDWQIREFEIDELSRRRSSVKRWAAVDLATQALDSADPVTGVRSAAAVAARARCAEILNAKTAT